MAWVVVWMSLGQLIIYAGLDGWYQALVQWYHPLVWYFHGLLRLGRNIIFGKENNNCYLLWDGRKLAYDECLESSLCTGDIGG